MIGELPLLPVLETTRAIPVGPTTVLAVATIGALCAMYFALRSCRATKRNLNACVLQLHEAQRELGTFRRPGSPPYGVPGVEHLDIQHVLTQVGERLTPMLGSGVSLDVLNVSKGISTFASERLERVLIYLAMVMRKSTPEGGTVTLRAYDGLGNVARGDGRRTWTIIEVGNVVVPTVFPPVSPSTDMDAMDPGFALAKHVVHDAGGRLEIEHRGHQGTQFILQLPHMPA
jgi:hypothetical protein